MTDSIEFYTFSDRRSLLSPTLFTISTRCTLFMLTLCSSASCPLYPLPLYPPLHLWPHSAMICPCLPLRTLRPLKLLLYIALLRPLPRPLRPLPRPLRPRISLSVSGQSLLNWISTRIHLLVCPKALENICNVCESWNWMVY